MSRPSLSIFNIDGDGPVRLVVTWTPRAQEPYEFETLDECLSFIGEHYPRERPYLVHTEQDGMWTDYARPPPVDNE